MNAKRAMQTDWKFKVASGTSVNIVNSVNSVNSVNIASSSECIYFVNF